jgi:23S rRNA-/tRNA-specific pseudouridylate synthase
MLRFTINLDHRLEGPLAALVLAGWREAAGGLAAPPDASHVARVIRQGSVWLGNRRLKDPDLGAGELRRLASAQERQIRHRQPERRICLQVFWPEKPIAEYSMPPSQVAWEDEHLLIAWKPAGVNTCQSVFSDTNCLTWAVQKLLDARAGIASDPADTEAEPPGRYVVRTINRLDYATRGLVFYAKHKEAEKALHRMFMERRVHKRYLAATAPLAALHPRSGQPWQPGDRLAIADPVCWQGKTQEALTLVRLLACGPERWWWAALPQTGRTHQIRKHFAARLLPLEGDLTYGGRALEGAAETGEEDGEEPAADPDSLLLACVAYRFRHPIDGRLVRVERIPEEFLNLDSSGAM